MLNFLNWNFFDQKNFSDPNFFTQIFFDPIIFFNENIYRAHEAHKNVWIKNCFGPKNLTEQNLSESKSFITLIFKSSVFSFSR